MKILFFGTSEFAIPTLERLKESGFELVGVVTQPDKPVGRKQEPLPSPVKKWALKNKIKNFQPETLELRIKNLELRSADIFIVASYGKIIPKEILDMPAFGALNIHPSILPRYRGPSPIQAAILNGDAETGVTIIKLDEEMDHGPILASTKLQITNSKPYYRDLHDQLAELGAKLLIQTLPDYISGKIQPVPQDHDKATFTKIIKKDDARIDWDKSAVEIDRMVRAYREWPVAWTTLDGKRLKIYQVLLRSKLRSRVRSSERSGTIGVEGGTFSVLCGKGELEILELQQEGKQKMLAKEFLRGQRKLAGQVLK